MIQPVLERRSFADKLTLAMELAEAIADRIRTAIAKRGQAAIAVSGDSTPGRFFLLPEQDQGYRLVQGHRDAG